MKRAMFGLALCASCAVDLTDPGGTLLTCAADADCPTGVCAANGLCVEERDDGALRLQAALAISLTTVELRFDDIVGELSEPNDFLIAPPLSVIAVERGDDPSTIVLTTSEQAFGVVYAVTASGLSDEQGNRLAADATSATFISFRGLPSTVPPSFVSPGAGTTVRATPARFAWSAIPGASRYFLDVATDAAFTENLQRLETPAVSLDVDVPLDVTYFARVRADITAPGVYSTLSFERINDIVYVRCDADPCDARGSGSRTAPLSSIALGIALARVTGGNEVRVAARLGAAAYRENLSITGRGVRLRGGFASDFANDSPNPAIHPTSISSINTVVDVADVAPEGGDVFIEALDIQATGPVPLAISVRNANGVELRNVRVYGGVSDDYGAATIGIDVRDDRATPLTRLVTHDLTAIAEASIGSSIALQVFGARFELHDSTFTALESKASQAIISARAAGPSEIDGCQASVISPGAGAAAVVSSPGAFVYVHDSKFRALNPGIADKGRALLINEGSARVERCAMEVDTVYADPAGIGLQLGSSELIEIRNVTVLARNARRAVDISRISAPSAAASPRISDSTFVAVGAEVLAASADNWSLANTLLVGATCVTEAGRSFPASFVGNALGCTNLYAPYQEPAVTPLTSIVDVNALNDGDFCGGGCPTNRRVNGNIAVTTSVAGLFVAYGAPSPDLHLSPGAPAALCNSGVDASAALCGSLLESPVGCGGDGTDGDGEVRGAPYCIGYDER